jgi:hypothetical protein
MVVIEGGRDHVGEEVSAMVTSVLQTSAGRMVFGRFEHRVVSEPMETARPAQRRERAL